jgi:CheY-like chemotaxis protein
VDQIVIDLRLRDTQATQLIEKLQKLAGPEMPPVLLYSKRKPTEEEQSQMTQLARISVVRHAQSPERVLYETALLLHRNDSDLSEEQRGLLAEVYRNDEALVGRKVLVVDDDLRNIFALTSALEQRGLDVVHAENGRAGIDLLKTSGNIDIVLMDIMMPEMDGYQTMRAIRQLPEFEALPIIALTAKAMKGDREKCIEAGASDYVPKPVDLDHLFAVMRVWMARGAEVTQTA